MVGSSQYWPSEIIYNDETAFRTSCTTNHAFYTLSKNYLNRVVVLDKDDQKKYEKQQQENLTKRLYK